MAGYLAYAGGRVVYQGVSARFPKPGSLANRSIIRRLMSSPTTQIDAVDAPFASGAMPAGGNPAGRLVAALKRGGDREEIFRRLFDLYRRPIYAFFRRNGFSEEDGRDLAQETFLRVDRGIDGFRVQSRFDTWLYEIAGNVRQKEIRRRKAIKRDMIEVSLEVLTVEPSGEHTCSERLSFPNPEGRLLRKERKQLVSAEVDKMPPQMRKCFRLWSEGCTFLEVAVLMRISINAVKSHLGQAKARLIYRLGGA